VSRTLFVSLAALSLAAPLHQALLAQRVVQEGKPLEASTALLPMSSSSAAAKMHATLGQRALDMGHPREAAQHFKEAVAADPTSAFAQLGAANASTSFADYDAKLAAAAKLAPHASRAEQLQIGIAQKALVSDFAGAEALARELVAMEPRNPRSFVALATVQQQMGKEADARRSLEQAIAVAPDFSPAYQQLAFSYMTAQPTDPPKARPYIDKLVVLEPKEPQAFISQGSFYRATNELPRARRAYTRAAELNANEALPLQQRAHVESFLGNYDAARADYDAAIKVGKQNEPATYGVFRALVASYAGNPKQSIAELDRLVANIDRMNLPDPVGAKIGALTAEAQIATQIGDFESASRAIVQRTPLVRQQVAHATDDKIKRLAEADIAYYEGLLAARKGDGATAKTKADEIMRIVSETTGLLAARKGDGATAKTKADEIMRIVSETTDPQKNQPAYAILGVLALEQKDYASAAGHLAQANPNDMFVLYEQALALEGAGKPDDAKALFRKIARYNFNSPSVAVARADAAKRAQ
jgi:tetratricopeptide (TPR) repeat protein